MKFWPVLLLTSLVGLVVRAEVGRKTFISFDEWQHLFMAIQYQYRYGEAAASWDVMNIRSSSHRCRI